jgi:hypothetical protein
MGVVDVAPAAFRQAAIHLAHPVLEPEHPGAWEHRQEIRDHRAGGRLQFNLGLQPCEARKVVSRHEQHMGTLVPDWVLVGEDMQGCRSRHLVQPVGAGPVVYLTR